MNVSARVVPQHFTRCSQLFPPGSHLRLFLAPEGREKSPKKGARDTGHFGHLGTVCRSARSTQSEAKLTASLFFLFPFDFIG